MDNKLILAIVMIIPFISGIGSCFYTKNFMPNDLEWLLVLLATIPFLNLICGIILIVMILMKKF